MRWRRRDLTAMTQSVWMVLGCRPGTVRKTMIKTTSSYPALSCLSLQWISILGQTEKNPAIDLVTVTLLMAGITSKKKRPIRLAGCWFSYLGGPWYLPGWTCLASKRHKSVVRLLYRQAGQAAGERYADSLTSGHPHSRHHLSLLTNGSEIASLLSAQLVSGDEHLSMDQYLIISHQWV